MFSEGGKADARTVKGRANAFFHEELYELFRLLSSSRGVDAVEKIKQINITVPLNNVGGDISSMFENPAKPEVLIFASGDMASSCEQKLNGQVSCYFADSIDAAKEILFNHDISVVLCDVSCGIKDADVKVLNAEDNAIRLIEANKQAIDVMVDALMEKNHLKENEIDDIFNRTVVSTELHKK